MKSVARIWGEQLRAQGVGRREIAERMTELIRNRMARSPESMGGGELELWMAEIGRLREPLRKAARKFPGWIRIGEEVNAAVASGQQRGRVQLRREIERWLDAGEHDEGRELGVFYVGKLLKGERA